MVFDPRELVADILKLVCMGSKREVECQRALSPVKEASAVVSLPRELKSR